MSGQQIRLCLFTFGPITSKQLNGLTTINTLSWLSGTSSALGERGPGFNSRLRQGFLCLIFCFVVVVCFLFLFKNTLSVTKVCNSLFNVNLFSILNILQDVWPIIKVYRYRPSIFNIFIWLNSSNNCFHSTDILTLLRHSLMK